MNRTYFEMNVLADKFRAEHGLSDAEPIHTKTLLRQLNIIAAYKPMSKGAYGLSLKSKDSSHLFMLINSNSTRGRQHFTIAHELYHLFCQEGKVTPHFCCEANGDRDKNEQRADTFASCLLLPRAGVLLNCPNSELAKKEISLATVLKIEQLFGLSHQATLYRLKHIGLMTEAALQQLIGINIIETAHLYGLDSALYKAGNEHVVIGDYGTLARTLFEQEKISEGHYNELLNTISYAEN